MRHEYTSSTGLVAMELFASSIRYLQSYTAIEDFRTGRLPSTTLRSAMHGDVTLRDAAVNVFAFRQVYPPNTGKVAHGLLTLPR
jgi:hypothetical protein